MASGGCDPSPLPSEKSDKGKGKKSNVVKLFSQINAATCSSSQPTTPTCTSTGRSVPPPLQVPTFTPSPPPVHVDRLASLSPHVGSNPSTPTTIAPSPSTEDASPHSSSAMNDVEDGSNGHPMIIPVRGGFYPSKTASKAITATIKQQFDKPWLTWGQIPNTDKGVFFECFKRKDSWKIEDEGKVKKKIRFKASHRLAKMFKKARNEGKMKKKIHFKASHRLAKMFKKARKEGKKPNWMGDNVWNGLLEKWNMPLYRQKCDTAKKNQIYENGDNLHTQGSISVNDHAIRLSQELGRSVHVDEICQQTHIRRSTKEFIDERSRRTHEEFQTRFSRVISETASVGDSTSSPLDPVEKERLRNRCRLEVANGRYKGDVYGIENFSIQDDCVNSYIRQTQASSSQQPNAEVLHNLQMQLASQQQQLRQMISILQGFIGVIMQYLPPPAAAVAQQFLHQINEQKNVPQNNVQAQDQPSDQP